MHSPRMDRIFAIWPSLAQLAADINRPYPTVAAWRQRGSIPAKYDFDLIRAAEARGCALTLEDIARARAAASSSKGA